MYGPRPWQQCEIVHPGQPLLMLVHGGGFVGGSMNSPNLKGWEKFAKQTGITVFNMDYRLATKDKPSFPGILYDIYMAVEYARKEYNPSSITILGTSAGATIALSAIPRFKIPARFIGFYGLYDLTFKKDFNYEVNGMIDKYVGDGVYTRRHASPLRTMKGVDGLLFHGDRDSVVDRHQSLLTGLPLITAEGMYHAFNIWKYSDEIATFVRS